MGKRKVGFKKPRTGVSTLKNAGSSDDEEIETNLEALLDDEISQYNKEKEQSLVKKKPKSKKRGERPNDSDEEQEVFGLDLTSSEDEEDHDSKEAEDPEADSDISDDLDEDNDDDILGDKDNDGIPDSRAWGRRARLYHNTDYVDQDFGGMEGSDAEQAELEEVEAKEIQKRLTAELDESDFMEFIPQKQEKSKKSKGDKSKEVLKVDFDSLSVTDKRKLIQRECPEVIHMLDEYKEKLEAASELKELIETEDSALIKEFYETKYHTILNYCINISYFLYLRATNPSGCKGHPVIKRVLQFRRLLDELNQFIPKKVKLEAERLEKQKKKRPVPAFLDDAKKPKKTPKLDKEIQKNSEPEVAVESDNESEKEDELEKRGITYEMAKNKGLTPARQKVQRNPRVKHRMKYQKAKVRRKGQVRTARTEVKKYDGESYGIKSNVTKSIKLK